jgi:hypothetical protein
MVEDGRLATLAAFGLTGDEVLGQVGVVDEGGTDFLGPLLGTLLGAVVVPSASRNTFAGRRR